MKRIELFISFGNCSRIYWYRYVFFVLRSTIFVLVRILCFSNKPVLI